MLWQIIFVVIGLGCLIYYGMICSVVRHFHSTFSEFWIAAGMLCFGMAYGIENEKVWRGVGLLMVIFLSVFVVTASKIIRTFQKQEEENCRYLVILGARIQGSRITESLRRRLDRAVDYVNRYPDTILIVSGGQGKGESITEAEAMEVYLIKRGISKSQILKESKSRSTEENLTFSKEYIEDKGTVYKTGIVSNNFHLYRALLYAKKAGYKKVYPIAASCRRILFFNYLVREIFAIWMMWLYKNGRERFL